jgi:hypothetical protein
VGSGVGPADADVVEPPGVAQGDGAGGADDVGADPVVGVCVAVVLAGGGFGPGGVGDRGRAPVRQGAVRAAGVVVGGEGIEQGLQLDEVSGLGALSSCSRPLRPPFPPENRVVNTIPLSVSVDAGVPWAAAAARNSRGPDHCQQPRPADQARLG